METCLSFLRLRPPAFDEGTSEDVCPFFAIWLWFTHNYNIRGHVLLQVKGELGIGNDVGAPVTGSTGFSVFPARAIWKCSTPFMTFPTRSR